MTRKMLLFMLALAAGPTTAQSSVIAHWTFDEGGDGAIASGAGSVLDSSGNGFHGTPSGSPVYRTLSGGGTGLEFDQEFVQVADSPLFESNSLTVEAIVNIDALPSAGNLAQIVFRGDDQAGLDPFYLGFLGEQLRWYIEGPSPGASALHASFTGLVDELVHVAGTIDDATGAMKLFINGAEVASTTTTRRPTLSISPLSGCGISIGALEDCSFSSPQQYLDGIIGEIRISNTALAPGQFLGATATVDEPSSLLLTGSLLGAIAARVRRRRGADRRR